MKYTLILWLFMLGCTRPLPKVGQCFERYLDENSPLGYEIVKVIQVDSSRKHSEITYVYNFPNEPQFKKGKWYFNKHLCHEGRYFFYRQFEKFDAVKEIPCPTEDKK